MYNKDYTYPNIELWDDRVWADHYTPFRILAEFLGGINQKSFRVEAGKGPYTGRTDGIWNGKTLSNFYRDYIDRWAAKGVTFHATEQGGVNWAAMLPESVAKRTVRDAKVLLVIADADYSDPNWLIHTLLRYEDYNELAAQGAFVPLYICPDGPGFADTMINIMQEFSVINNLRMQELYLDLTPLVKTGAKIADAAGYTYTDAEGNPADPDACVETLCGLQVLPISGRWQNKTSMLRNIFSDWLSHPLFDSDAFVYSTQGREMAEALRIEFDYLSCYDPAFRKLWEDKGLDFGLHDHKGFQWLSFVPKAYLGQTDAKLPVVLLFQEVTYQDPHQVVSAVAAYRNYCELAASGELILLIFALESCDDNDMFLDICDEAAALYPIDLDRVYVTGQSHNGYFTDEFVRRHHERVAACALLGNHPGIPEADCTTANVLVPDSAITACRAYDMPAVIVTSGAEIHNPKLHCRGTAPFTEASRAWQRRLEANRCAVPDIDTIAAAMTSEDPIIRKLQYPVDCTSVELHCGTPCYVGDVINEDGNRHLRLVVIENQSHFITPQMPELSWEFLRRFARDRKTGACVELF